MPKSKHRKRKKQAGPEAPFVMLQRQSTTESVQNVRQAVAELSKRETEKFPERVQEIDRLLREQYPPYLLSIVSSYGLMAIVTPGKVQANFDDGVFNQHHAEMLQAMMLRIERATWSSQPPTPDKVDETFKALGEASRSFFQMRFLQDVDIPDEDLLLQSIQEKLRMNTQIVRNWGHFSQVIAHSRELYSILDPVWEEQIGLKFNQVVDVVLHILKRLDQLTNERVQMLRKIARAPTKQKMLERYHELCPDLVGTPSADTGPFKEMSKDETFQVIVAHNNLKVSDHYTFSSQAISEATGISKHSITRMLDTFSLEPGELADKNVEYLWLDNPVWAKPFVRLQDGEYFSSVPHAFFSHIHKIVRGFVQSVGEEDAFSDARSRFLEDKLASIVRGALPSAKIFTSFKWTFEGTQFETDVIAVVDQCVVIFEAKSGMISEQGLRGAPDRLKRHVKDLLLEPSIQSERLRRLIQMPEDQEARKQIAKDLKLKQSTSYRVARASVLLEDFSPLAACERELKDVGWITPEHELAPALTVANFESVADILDDEGILLHYLFKRAPIQNDFDIQADELDLLGFYLETGFAIHGLKREEITTLHISGASAPIDNYYNCLDADEKVSKPRIRLPRLWRDTLRQLRERKFSGWTTAADAMLSCASPAEMRRFSSQFDKVLRSIPPAGKKPEHKFIGVVSPPYENATALCFFAYRTAEREKRSAAAMELSAQCYDKPNVQDCWLLGFDVDIGRLDRIGSSARETTPD